MDNSMSYKLTDKMRDLVKDSSALILVMGRLGISLGFGDKSVREAFFLEKHQSRVCKLFAHSGLTSKSRL